MLPGLVLRAARSFSSTQNSISALRRLLAPYPSLNRPRIAKQTSDKPPLPSIKRSTKPTSLMSPVHVQIIGTAHDLAPTIYIFTDQHRYIINCGEGTQRFCTEHGVRIRRVSQILLTRLDWEHIGGLPGMMLTLSDVTSDTISICGPRYLRSFFRSMWPFIPRSRLNLDLTEVMHLEPIHTDEMSFIPVVLRPTTKADSSAPSPSFSPVNEGIEIEKSKDAMSDSRDASFVCEPVAFDQQAEDESNTEAPSPRDALPKWTICYVVHIAAPPGKFDSARAKALGVKPGPDFGILQKGGTVTLANGTVVHPEDVMASRPAGPVFAVIDCPSAEYLTSLTESESLPQLLHAEGRVPNLMVHMTPASVFESEVYQQWMKTVAPNASHVVVNAEYSRSLASFTSAMKQQAMLNAIDSEIFPIPYECRESPRIPLADPALKVVVAEPLMKFHLLPVAKMGVDSSVQLASVDIKAQQQLAFEIPQLQASIEQLRQMRPSLVNRQTTDDGEIVFLGTGSALPSKYRNVSGICITVPPLPGGDAKYVIMDCGEGTLGQLYRLFGPNIKTFLQNLVCIQISHLHADHHLGLLRLLHARQQLEGAEGWNPVVVVGPGPLNKWLMDYSSLESLPFTFINCAHLIPTSRHFTSTSRTLSHIGVKSISACSVVHCPLAFGLSLEHDSGWKVTYSGDTRPCQSLVDLGRNSTVLIHEATFDDDLRAEAVMKKHSTTAEAIDVGNRMNAQFTILTHFSQRYPKIPVFDDCTNHTTGVAFDFMRVHMRNLPVLSHLVPPLKLLFADEIFAREAGEEA